MPRRQVFEKYEKSGGRWRRSCRFTIPEFVRDNAHDEWVIEEFVPKLRALRPGASWVYRGGAGGDDKFVRVR